MKLKSCIICGSLFKTYPANEHRARFCSKSCCGKGTLAGLARTPEWKRHIALTRLGKKLSEETKQKLRVANLGKFAKEKHWNWKGGLAKDKNHKREYDKKWRSENLEHVRELRRKHGAIQRERRRSTATRPAPLFCEVCGSNKKIVFDHDHATNKFRGWLCDLCNITLGTAKDNPVVLRKLADYLEVHS